MTTTDTFWHWRGYTIWAFDGYFDVHHKGDPQPIAEGFATADDAREFIRDWDFSEQVIENLFTARRWRR